MQVSGRSCNVLAGRETKWLAPGEAVHERGLNVVCYPDGTVCTAIKVDYDLEGKVDGFTLYAQYDPDDLRG